MAVKNAIISWSSCGFTKKLLHGPTKLLPFLFPPNLILPDTSIALDINLFLIYTYCAADNTDFEGLSPYDMADMLKQYFRELPDPILTSKLAETFITIFSSK